MLMVIISGIRDMDGLYAHRSFADLCLLISYKI